MSIEIRIALLVDDEETAWVTRVPVVQIYDATGARPYVEDAAAQACMVFVRNLARDEQALRELVSA